MNRRSIPRPGLVSLVCACFAVSPAAAEVAAEPHGTGLNVIVMGIIEDPDPICHYWAPVRYLDPDLVLNPDGTDRGDGRPDFAFESTTARPHVVWSYNVGTDHDVAYSRWAGGRWSGTVFLTSDGGDQLDPRIFLVPDAEDDDDHELHVVWWQPGATPTVWWIRKPSPGAPWTYPERVTDPAEVGRRPSVAEYGGTVFVSYERATAQGTEIVVARRQTGGSYAKQVIVATSHTGLFDPVLHVQGDKMWLDWKGSGQAFAYSVYSGSQWDAPVTMPWTDFSWLGLVEARAVTEGEVLAP